MRELNDALKAFAAPQSGVGAVVLTGNEKAFAGASAPPLPPIPALYHLANGLGE